jgi:DNA polymerase-4
VIAHLDLDAFFAACEQLDHPELRGVPLVVGGDPESRGVVATASYEARAFGIGSAMSSAEARRRCPQAVFVPANHQRYRERSREVWGLVERLCPRIEQVGIDEGYLDLASVVEPGAVRGYLGALQAAVRSETGLGCSLGAGGSKTVAKIASDRRKPGGIVVVPPGEDAAFLAPLALRLLPGVGPRGDERLRAAGCATIGDLAALGPAELAAVLPGKVGEELQRRARGLDDRPVAIEPAEPVTISCEETYARDLVDRERLRSELDQLSDRTWERLGRSGYLARTVTVKLRYPDFAIATRARTLDEPLGSGEELARIAFELLEKALADRPAPLRLLGVGTSKLAREFAAPAQLRLPLEEREPAG